ncbi:unnamed protein product [Staurois parvus]|uniref:Uncharacterized protein n=1 Tax=Staurois parvus TaxID=386267 RepID=A0ABN9EMA2_9NEOB|nr:unnamed protein product [Staurois parvus]
MYRVQLCCKVSAVDAASAAVNLNNGFLQPFSAHDASVEVLTSMDSLNVSVRWLQFHLC